MHISKLLLSCLCFGILSSTANFSQPAHADSDWVSLLSPLLKEVVSPALEKGLENWKAKREQKKAEQENSMYELEVTTSTETSSVADANDGSEGETTASGWKLPEEPVH